MLNKLNLLLLFLTVKSILIKIENQDVYLVKMFLKDFNKKRFQLLFEF
jgi:hypothetical protein